MVVWIGSTAFDGFTYQPFWQDVLGTSTGWTRTLLNTVGLLWITAIVAGAFLLVVRVAERGQREADRDRRLTEALGPALVPLAVGWFLGHDLTLLLAEGQNAYALISDPFGRGWDLFGTYDHTIDYSILTAGWVPWVQLVADRRRPRRVGGAPPRAGHGAAAARGRRCARPGRWRRWPARRSPRPACWC